jgi:dTDP-glucose 4,6-dehydratase
MRLKSSRILVTGGAGFIGSEFVRQALEQGYKIAVLDSLTYAGDLQRLKEVKGRFAFFQADIGDAKKVAAAFKKFKPAVVAHFAAETHVDRSILDSSHPIRTNVLGTQVLVEQSRQSAVECFLHVSTDEVYGDIEAGHFYETSPLNPSSPYSAAKAAADLLVKAYMRTYQFPAMIVRPSNNYGPWQYPEKFVPVVIYKALKNQKIPVYAQGLNIREWLYVSDCASAILQVLKKGKTGEIYNIGSGQERTNIVVVETLLEILGKPKSLIEFVKDRPGHDYRYALSSEKIRRELGWMPVVPFDVGMKKTVDHCRANMKWLERKVSFLKSYWKKVYHSAGKPSGKR